MVRTRLLALLLVVAIAAAACGSSTTESGSDESGAADVSGGVFEGAFATLDGGSVDLAEFEGQDVVLWFWAPW